MVDVPATTIRPPSPATMRIVDVAAALFYRDGIRATGIDRIVADAEVTKATFYKHYASKDQLILEYVTTSSDRVKLLLIDQAAKEVDPADKIRALARLVADDVSTPDFRGCRFANAAIEFPDLHAPVRQAVYRHREWQTELMHTIMVDLGHPMPGDAADDFMLLRDGAMTGGFAGDRIAVVAALGRGVERLIAEAH